VITRLDYGNGALIGLPTHLVRHLQSVRNAKCSCTVDPRTWALLSHYRCPGQLALAARSGARRLQVRLTDVLSTAWDRTGVSLTC